MKIQRIWLSGVGPYRDPQGIEIDGLNIAIIAPNGYGKTWLKTAIESTLKGRKLPEGEVRLHCQYEDKNIIVSMSKDGGVMYENGRKTAFKRLYDFISPEAIQFMFFDGENIRNYALSLGTNTESLAWILGLGDIILAKKKIEEDIFELQKKIGHLEASDGLTRLKKDLGHLRSRMTKNQKHLTAYKKEVYELGNKISQLEKDMATHIHLNEAKNNLALIEERLERSMEKQKNLEMQMATWFERAYIAILNDFIISGIDSIEKMKDMSAAAKIQVGKYMAQIDMLGAIIEREKCICGAPLAKSKEGKNSISVLQSSLIKEASRYEDIAMAEFFTSAQLRDAYSEVVHLPSKEKIQETLAILDRVKKEIASLKKDKKREKQLIKKDLALLTNASYKDVRSKLAEYQTKKGNLMGKIDEALNEQEKNNALVNRLSDDLKALQSAINMEIEPIERKISSLEKERKKLNNVLKKDIQNTLKRVIKSTEAFFLGICGKKEYTGLVYKNDTLCARSNRGIITPEQMSDGEKHLLVISLIAGLRSLNPDTPVIMDAPLSRLDENNRKKVLKRIQDFGSQIIFLATDRELSVTEAPAYGFKKIYTIEDTGRGSYLGAIG